MDIKNTLQTEFAEVNNAFFDKEMNMLFLRVEVNLKTLDEVSALSRKISDFLDKHEVTEEEYFLDVYSAGTEKVIQWEELESSLNENVMVTVKRIIKNRIAFEGTLLEVTPEKIIIEWNAKGQFRKQEIEKENVQSVKLSTKIK